MDKSLQRQLLKVIVLIAAVLCLGAIGYVLVEGWSFLDGFYMTLITLATIGYGETHPLSTAGRIYTIFLILGGISLITYAFSTLTALLVGGQLTDSFRRRKMEKNIQALKNHYIVCGAGHTAMSIIEELRKTGRPFVVIEQNPDEAKKLAEKGYLAFAGDATSDDALLLAGAKAAYGVFCALKNDKDNAFIALAAKGLNPALRIISSQSEADVKDKLLRSGCDATVNPGRIGGMRMVSEMVRPATVGFLDWMLRDSGQGWRFEDVVIPEDSPLKNKPLGELKGAQGNAALAVAIKFPDKNDYELNPSPHRKIVPGEILVVLGDQRHTEELRRILSGR